MTCFSPLLAYKGKGSEPGKSKIVFSRPLSWRGEKLDLPCGQCAGCRLERSRQWAIRCVHEASLHEENSFVTLTYDDAHLPPGLSLDVSHFQNFMKRLRRANEPKKIRFYHCGEYGERTGRPHYHALLFNHGFADRKFYSQNSGNPLYTSDSLSRLWPYGRGFIGDVTFESAAYVARYVMKKVTGEMARDWYGGRKPEYTTMSRRPGIGKEWFDKFKGDVYPRDAVVFRGRDLRPPRFYDSQLEKQDPSTLALLKIRRASNERFVTDTLEDGRVVVESDSSLRRLAVKEVVKLAEISALKRPLE